MAILDTVKKGYLTLKTATGYVKLLPRTLASLVSTSDGSNVQTKLDTINNNLKNMLSVKLVTVKSNINVGAGKDFNYSLKSPTVNGYTPIGVIGYDLVGDWDAWVNIVSCYYNSSNDLFLIKGHNFGTGTCSALANVFVLYKKN